MEKETKVKLIIGSVIGILVLLLIFILVTTLLRKAGKADASDTISLTAQRESDFTVDDMIKVSDKGSSSDQGSILSTRNDKDREYDFAPGGDTQEGVYQTDDEDIKRLQEALKNEAHSKPPRESKPANIPAAKTSMPPIKEQLKTVSPSVTPKAEPVPVSEPKTAGAKGNRFFRASEDKIIGNTVTAVVHGEQTISNKGTLKMRLLEDVYTSDGTCIPKDTYVYGVAAITEERIQVSIQSVRIGKNIYPLNRQIFDQDGLSGINVPENVKAEIAKRATSQSIQDAPVQTTGGNIVTKGANTVVGAAKNILSKDAQEIKVTIKSNYKIYLK